jgi:hypothetical protein
MDGGLIGSLIGLAVLIITNGIYVGWRFGRLEERVTAIDERGPKGLSQRLSVLEQKVQDIDDRGCGAFTRGRAHS